MNDAARLNTGNGGWQSLLEGYAPLPGVADELVDATGEVRPVWQPFLRALAAMGGAELESSMRRADQYLRDAGVSHQSLLAREDPAAFTLTNVNVTYRKPGKVDDLLHIRTRYLGMDGPRIRFSQACLRGGELLAEAEITAVMIHADGRLRRPIKEISEHLEAYRWSG